MREIKFRAWDGERMLGPCDVESLMFSYGQNHDHLPWKKSEDGSVYTEAIIMQYTGLKDKNGKEIYEGDILSINPEDDDWEDIVVWWEKWARFELKSYVNQPEPHTMVVLGEMQQGSENPAVVIGNIYENPELLNN